MTGNARDNILAALVLAAFVGLLAGVPHESLRPFAAAALALGVLGVLGARAYYRRLHEATGFLSRPENLGRPDLLAALLTRPERVVLRVASPGGADRALRALRRGQSATLAIGMGSGIGALIAFLVLAWLYDL